MSGHPPVLVELCDLQKQFPLRTWGLGKKAAVNAVDHVSLKIYEGETLALVGESGCGKSTLGRLILRLLEPSGGDILYRGESLPALPEKKLRNYREKMQMVFQDPYGSLNPRMRVESIVEAPLKAFGIGSVKTRRETVISILRRVGLSESLHKRPAEFSGGQRQRIGIARALAPQPEFIVCDEAVSALDVSTRAEILNLLKSLKRDYNLTCLFISHDLSVVNFIADRVAVMYLGQIMELASRESVFRRPFHPYTRILLDSIPTVEGGKNWDEIRVQGELPNAHDLPSGCRFHTRCAYTTELCRKETPSLRESPHEKGHFTACLMADMSAGL
jgi:peptide/nickel transport system ATP-binding protein/oligopeptide transport system ATP-binding protein